MGKGKRRNTAKTGDKSLYKKVAESRKATAQENHDDNDTMYNAVDQFHNQREEEFLKLDGAGDHASHDSDEEQEAVMDLGVGGSSEEDDDDDDDSDDDSRSKEPSKKHQGGIAPSSSSDDDDEEEDVEDVRDWGRKKSAYYHADTTDLELGQDEEDAFMEEDAAKEVQAARLKEMDEADFILSDDEDEQNRKTKQSTKKEDAEGQQTSSSRLSSIRDVSKLSSKDRRKLLEKQHPGLQQILSHFQKSVQDLQGRTSLATRALFQGEDDGTAEAIGCTTAGKKYLLTKTLLQATTALNLAIFLLLKSEESSSKDDRNDFGSSSSLVQFHPVMKRLQEWNVLTQKLKGKVEDSVQGLNDQLDSLIKAVKLMESMAEDVGEGEVGNETERYVQDTDKTNADEDKGEVESNGRDPAHSSSSSDDDDSSMDQEAVEKTALHNARFGLRPNEVEKGSRTAGEMNDRRSRRAAPSDFGDDGDEEANNKDASRYLASTINTIEQRAASRKKVRVKATEELDAHREADDDLRRGLDMMEEEFGKESDEDVAGDGMEAEGDDEDGGFYTEMAKKNKAKRDSKKSLYSVAPKFPRMDGEIEGERPIGRMIMKNRGLVAHKNKLNRNPRVKKREQYRKALIRRKGTVREVRTDEGHKYGGEETGIKSRISRSRKLGAN